MKYSGVASSIKRSLTLLLLSALAASGRPGAARAAATNAAPKSTLTVMTRNLYAGADFYPLLFATTPAELQTKVAEVYARILSSQYPCRAEAIAQEIVQHQPDLVGLQEAIQLRVKSPCTSTPPDPPRPVEFAIDYAQILVDALERQGAHYTVVASDTNTDLTAPTPSGDQIRLTDRDVILARTDLSPQDLRATNPRSGNFKAHLEVPVAGTNGLIVTILRGWCAVDVRVRGRTLVMVNTHLEEEAVSSVQLLQADELLTGPLHTARPLICVGDFNSPAGAPATNTYARLRSAGLGDAWSLARPADPGFSCCQAEDLLNPVSQLSSRIDLIWFRAGRLAVDHIQLLDQDPSDRLSSGLWPSDHAGVVGVFHLQGEHP